MKNTTLPSQPATSLFGRLVEMFHAAMDKLVPYGYEDDAGFHYVEPPVRVRHMVRFHAEPAPSHSRSFRTRHARPSFHSYRVVTREAPSRAAN